MYEVVTGASKVADALRQWRRLLLDSEGRRLTRTITHPPGAEERQLIWLPQFRFWAHIGSSNDRYIWCPYGYSNSEPANPVNISLEINPVVSDDAKRARGRILRDSNGRLLLAHKGGRGGGRGRQVKVEEFRRRIRGIEKAEAKWPDGTIEPLFVLGAVAAIDTLKAMAKYLRQAEELAAEASERAQLGALIDFLDGQAKVPPGSTETKQEVLARLGQGKFRERVLKRWSGVCAITKIGNLNLVRASHIRPWSKCVSEDDRLNPANGLPLIPNYDALFDRGFISFSDTGRMLVSRKLSLGERRTLGVPAHLSRALNADEVKFMAYHRKSVFRR